MALRFFGRAAQPASAPRTRGAETAPASGRDAYLPGDQMPLPEVEEKNTDSIWALWTDAVNEKDEAPQPPAELLPDFLQTAAVPLPEGEKPEAAEEDLDTFPATQIMDLPEMLKGHE